MSRLDNIMRINMYDKSKLQSEEVRLEKHTIRKVSKQLEH